MSDIYRILSTSSMGYRLYNCSDKSLSIHQSRGRMLFKLNKLTVGDYVSLDSDGFIFNLEERKSYFSRPRMSNIDEIFVLVSAKEPDFDTYLLDKFLTLISLSQIKASIIVSKVDLLDDKEMNKLKKRLEYYKKINYNCYLIDAFKPHSFDYDKLVIDIKDKSVAFVGQTGVGKSSILNSLCPDFKRKVDSLYVSSGRGRHTTKEVILLPYEFGFLFDTPGFSSFELEDVKTIDLAKYFPGFSLYSESCYFKDCKHLNNSKNCRIVKAVNEGDLSSDSYDNYCKIYEEIKVNDLWKKKL